MRKSDVRYVCDRCGAEKQMDGKSNGRFVHELNNDGWRRITIGAYKTIGVDQGIRTMSPMHRDLCRLCYGSFVGFIEMDKPDYATVQ